MKTCKYGCGGKMKSGGKVAAVKKMAKGGSAGCPPGQCAKYVGGKREGCEPCKAGIIAGITAGVSGALGVTGKMISDAVKAKKAKKKEKEVAKNSEEKRRGGATKKYQMGGSTIVGMPKYSNNPRTDEGRVLKNGGVTNRAVKPGCRGGMVKDASGNCVNERKFKAGGATTDKKFAALAPPYNKATFADKIAGAKKNSRKK